MLKVFLTALGIAVFGILVKFGWYTISGSANPCVVFIDVTYGFGILIGGTAVGAAAKYFKY